MAQIIAQLISTFVFTTYILYLIYILDDHTVCLFNQEQQLVAGQVLQDLQDFQAAEVVYFQGAEVL